MATGQQNLGPTIVKNNIDALKNLQHELRQVQKYIQILTVVAGAPAVGGSTEVKQDVQIGFETSMDASLTSLEAKDFATQTTLVAVLAKIIAAPATEVKQDTLITAINLLAKLADTQPVSLPTGTETPALTRTTAAGSVVAGARTVSLLNIGTTDATVLGTLLPAGISIDYEASVGKTLGVIAYTASATSELLISTTV